MSRTSWLFVFGVVLPSLLLAWLAWRSIEQQQVVVENQAAALYESETQLLAEETRNAIAALEEVFAGVARSLNGETPANEISAAISSAIPGGIGFILAYDSEILVPPSSKADADAQTEVFLEKNRIFLEPPSAAPGRDLSKREEADDAQVVVSQRALVAPAAEKEGKIFYSDGQRKDAPVAGSKLEYANVQQLRRQSASESSIQIDSLSVADSAPAPAEKQVAVAAPEAPVTTATSAALELGASRQRQSGFRRAIGDAPSGLLARFTEDGTELFLWQRLPNGLVAGCALAGSALADWLRSRLPEDTQRTGDYTLALLDERGLVKWTSRPGEALEGKPFVGITVGDPLPMWDAALWLTDPSWLASNARQAKLTIALLTTVSLGVILMAGFMVMHNARRQIELAQRKSDFVSSVSHELKTPLTAIRMFTELLQQPALAVEKREKFTGIIAEECERLSRLVTNVLTFSRLEHPRNKLPPAFCDLAEIVPRVVARQSEAMNAAGSPLEFDSTESICVAMAGDEVEQVLLNLLANAEKYAAGSGPVRVEIECEASFAELRVSDSGPGIPRGEERRIFLAFERAVDAMSSGKPGAGLGLAICARLLAERGGSISCGHAAKGGGAMFTCRIPIQTESLPCPSAS